VTGPSLRESGGAGPQRPRRRRRPGGDRRPGARATGQWHRRRLKTKCVWNPLHLDKNRRAYILVCTGPSRLCESTALHAPATPLQLSRASQAACQCRPTRSWASGGRAGSEDSERARGGPRVMLKLRLRVQVPGRLGVFAGAPCRPGPASAWPGPLPHPGTPRVRLRPPWRGPEQGRGKPRALAGPVLPRGRARGAGPGRGRGTRARR
jgi:hypothetical protein